MASYVHECTSCGTALSVHERYFGRLLRCTACGAHFEAVPPPEAKEAAVTPAPVELPEAPSRSRLSWKMWLAAGVGLIGLAAILVWLSTSPVPKAVEPGVLATVSAEGDCPAALDSATAAVLGKHLANQEPLAPAPGLTSLRVGDRVQILGFPNDRKMVPVRVLNGQWASRKVWVPARRLVLAPDPSPTAVSSE